MKSFEKITSDMKFDGKSETYWFNPVVAFGINSNIKIVENEFFSTEAEAQERGQEIVETGELKLASFSANTWGSVKCKIKSLSGYSDGPFEREHVGGLKYCL
jgi:hypothetical protein